jgi:HSP20 family protein
MGAAKNKESVDLKYVKQVISQVMGEDLWNGFYDVVTSERPRIDMYDDGNTIYIVAEAPGILNQNDISVSASANRLNIRGAIKDKYQHHKPGKILKSECLYGAFNRTLILPYPVDEKNIKAVYECGVLEVTLQRVDTVNENEVEIKFKK